jgi:hypothetical protein
MIFQGVPWRNATMRDPNFCYYLDHRRGHFEPFQKLIVGHSHILERILEPDPNIRITIEQFEDDAFFRTIEVCSDENYDSSGRKHNHFRTDYEV